MTAPLDSRDGGKTFRERLNRAARTCYHHRHPFNHLMHAGLLTREDLKLWVATRYYYQQCIPLKDALILAKSQDAEFRRVWVQRILEHDGALDHPEQPGGLQLWVRLALGVGLSREDLETQRHLLPSAKRACDDYVELVRSSDLVTAVAASLTERFATALMQARLRAWRVHYSWVAPQALAYFERRVSQSRLEAEFALDFVERHARSEAEQERCISAFCAKCDVLWRLLDAVYVTRRWGLVPRLSSRAALTSVDVSSKSRHTGGLLLAPELGLELNAIGVELLEHCDGATRLACIATDLAGRYGVSVEQVKLDLARFLAELERRRLLVFEAAAS